MTDDMFDVVSDCRHGLDPKACKKCIDAARKREDRKRERIEKEADKSQTLDAFWKAQQSLVSPSTLAPLLARQERVLDSLHWLKQQLDGTYDVDPNDAECYVSFEEGAAGLIEDFKTFGYVETQIAMPDFNFWQNPERFKVWTSGNVATATFARYGIVTAIPSHHYSKFQKFLKQKYLKERHGMSVPEYVYVGAEVLAPTYDGKGYPTENARQEKSK